MRRTRLTGSALAVFALLASSIAAQEHEHPSSPPEKLGTVHFPNSCSAAAQPQVTRAVALLHSFEFNTAIDAFEATLKTDPSCAIAYWGIALSQWTNPFAAIARPLQRLKLGLDAVQRGQQAGAKTERERAYLAAVSKLYVDFDTLDQRARTLAYEKAMADLAAAYPDESEASIFYALSLAASALPTDKTYANQLKAGAILEKLFPQQPDHPGIAHYIIHSYDVPVLAPKALDAARRYAKIAPSAPHALHMPSHTFTRVGYWQESIDTNIASAAAAQRDRSTGEELHALDYQTYAYLQTAEDAAAKRVVDSLREVAARFDPDAIGGAAGGAGGIFALAAIPARYALERRAWAEAATLEPHPSRFPYTEGMTYFARALGAAHTGDTATARSAIDALRQIRERLSQANDSYWTEQVEIQRRGASAWLALAEGGKSDALAEMQAAAAREDATEKNAVTPGPIAPARELLGDMLMQMDQPSQALKEYETTLKQEPNRFRAVYGAAQAAARAGDRATAQKYYRQLLKICQRADKPGRPELAEARSATASRPAAR